MSKVIGVAGSGIMGSGIAQVAATAGFDVFVYDLSEQSLENAKLTIEKYLSRDVEKERLTENDKLRILKSLTFTTDLTKLKDAYFVIEAVTEKMEIKQQLFKQLEEICSADTFFATNTSGISITGIASVLKRPERFIGIHFFNPVPAMELVEITRGYHTSDETFEAAKNLANDFGKDPIFVKDSPLFVFNRILLPMINEAIFVLSEGVASKEDIDKAMLLGAKHPIGPLALADVIGLDTLLYVLETLYEETNDSKYRPATLLKQMVRAGLLGRKTGEGFYKYE